MKTEKKNTGVKRNPTILEAIIPMISMLVVLFIGKGIMGYQTEPLLIFVTFIAAIIAMRVGVTWDEMMDEMSQKIAKGMPAILILISVGAMIASWIASGTIPMMIYYGVQIVNPNWLLVTAFLICIIVSTATGTSWGTIGTIGVAIIGIATALGVSLPATAGAIVSGSYFGDKMSPLSDTTNLAPIAAGSSLYEHIGHMFWTTIPAAVICIIVYTVAGVHSVSATTNLDSVNTMMSQLSTMYKYNLLLIIPVLMVLVGSVMQKPAIPVMLLSTFIASLEAIFIQNTALADLLSSLVKGFNVSMVNVEGFDISTVLAEVANLLNRGGMNSMLNTTLLVFCSFCFAGIMSRSGCLDIILNKILKFATSTGKLVLATVISCMTMGMTTGSSYLSILIPGEMFRDAYKARGLKAKNLSRTLEDSGTVFVPLIPWSAAGAGISVMLGVDTLSYLPWAVLCYTGFIFAIIYGFTGIGIARENKKEDKAEN